MSLEASGVFGLGLKHSVPFDRTDSLLRERATRYPGGLRKKVTSLQPPGNEIERPRVGRNRRARMLALVQQSGRQSCQRVRFAEAAPSFTNLPRTHHMSQPGVPIRKVT